MKNEFIIDTLRHQLRAAGTVQIEGTGTSMWPLIQSGQKVTVLPCEPRRLVVGDLVLYRTAEGMVVHRVVRIIKKPELRFLCRGDSSDTNDPAIQPDDIIGQVSLPTFANQLFRVKVKLRERLRSLLRLLWP